MTLVLPMDPSERFDHLKLMKWHTSSGSRPATMLTGTKVTVATRGCLSTDREGLALSLKDIDSAAFLSSTLNNFWQKWLNPELERYQKEGIEIPNEISSLLIMNEDGCWRLYINSEFTGSVVARASADIKKGDPLDLEKIIDLIDMDPPSYNGRAAQYYLVRFSGKQISIVFNFEPRYADGPVAWTSEDSRWFGSAFAEQFLAYVYGHIYPKIPTLTACDIAFSIGVVPNKMNALVQEAAKGREFADLYLTNNMGLEDWQRIVNEWGYSESWRKRKNLFETALSCYQHELYSATICTLIPQIEGVIMEYLVANGKGLKNNGWSRPWGSVTDVSSVLGELSELFIARDFGVIRKTVAGTLLHFLEHSTLYSPFSWRDGGEPLGRHAILHGYEVGFGDKCNADRLFMVLDSLFNLIGHSSKSDA